MICNTCIYHIVADTAWLASHSYCPYLIHTVQHVVNTYAPLLEELQMYLDEGWRVEIFSWVVSVRGLLDSDTIESCLEFLEILWHRWRWITEDTASESVKAFYSLHCIRCKALMMGPRSSELSRAACHIS